MLAEGADVNSKDARGITPLGVAVGFNKLPIVEALLEAGADVEAADPKGNTALHYAAGQLLCLLQHVSPLKTRILTGRASRRKSARAVLAGFLPWPSVCMILKEASADLIRNVCLLYIFSVCSMCHTLMQARRATDCQSKVLLPEENLRTLSDTWVVGVQATEGSRRPSC